jgi:CIC family chloride channel protein
MGALIAATVRAPLTAILLTIEMTANYLLILPILVSCLTATMTAHGLGGRPIYTVLLERQLIQSGHLNPSFKDHPLRFS